MTDAQVKLQVQLDDKQATSGINNLKSKTDKLSSSFANAGKKLTLGLTVPIVGLATAAVKSTMDLEATEAKYNTVFEGMTEEVDNFIVKFKELTPATTAEARSMASGIQDLLVPMGFARDEATALTGDTMHLIGALTNFNSATHSAEDVSLAFSSALTGETQSLKRLGIQVDVATLTQRAMEMTGKKNTDEITRQEKALALMELSYEQSTDALAAYNEESLDTKTRMGLANAEFKDSLAILGAELLPVISDLVRGFAKFAKWLGSLDGRTKKIIIAVAGFLAVLGPILMVVGGIIKIIPIMITLFKAIGIVIAAVTSPIGLVVVAIGLLIGAIWLLIKHWDTVKQVFVSVWDFIKSVFMSVIEWFKSAFGWYIGIYISAFNLIKGLFTGLWNGIKNIFSTVIGWFKTGIKGFVGIFTGAFNGIRNAFSAMWNGIKAMFQKGGQLFVGFREGVAGVFKTIVNGLIGGINRVLALPFKSLNNTLNRIRSVSVLGIEPFSGLWKHNPIPVPKIPSLDVGTPFVKRDGLAMLHQGEAVVTRADNKAGLARPQTMYLTIQSPDISLDGRRVSRAIAPYHTEVIKVGGGNV